MQIFNTGKKTLFFYDISKEKKFINHKDPNKRIEILGKLKLLDDAKNQQIFESSFAEFINPRKKNKDWKLKQAAKGNLKIEDLLKRKKKK